jgi:endonuclease/exonuclease/phosphatase (EEP) superfamily protein YafD
VKTRLPGWITLLAVLTGLIGQVGRFSVRADLVNFFAPAWLSIGGIAAILLIATSRHLSSKLAGAGAVVTLGVMALTLWPASTSPASDCAGDEIRLVQFNILKDNKDVQPAIAWIKGTQADVVTLEEAAGELPILAGLRSQYPYAVACAAALRCSTIILSRRPFVASGGLARGDPENRGGLSAAWATLASSAGPFTIVAAHLDRPWPWHSGPDDVAMLSAFVRSRDRATTLVAGDFNRPAWSFQIRQLTGALGLARATDIRSWPAMAFLPPLLAIDHVFAGRRWSVAQISRGPALGSDHYPLLAQLRISPVTCPAP